MIIIKGLHKLFFHCHIPHTWIVVYSFSWLSFLSESNRPNALPIIRPIHIPIVRLCMAEPNTIPHKTVIEIGNALFFIDDPSLASCRSLALRRKENRSAVSVWPAILSPHSKGSISDRFQKTAWHASWPVPSLHLHDPVPGRTDWSILWSGTKTALP